MLYFTLFYLYLFVVVVTFSSFCLYSFILFYTLPTFTLHLQFVTRVGCCWLYSLPCCYTFVALPLRCSLPLPCRVALYPPALPFGLFGYPSYRSYVIYGWLLLPQLRSSSFTPPYLYVAFAFTPRFPRLLYLPFTTLPFTFYVTLIYVLPYPSCLVTVYLCVLVVTWLFDVLLFIYSCVAFYLCCWLFVVAFVVPFVVFVFVYIAHLLLLFVIYLVIQFSCPVGCYTFVVFTVVTLPCCLVDSTVCCTVLHLLPLFDCCCYICVAFAFIYFTFTRCCSLVTPFYLLPQFYFYAPLLLHPLLLLVTLPRYVGYTFYIYVCVYSYRFQLHTTPLLQFPVG